jgi:hypothetical protein
MNGLALDAMLLDAKVEHRRRDVGDSEWRHRNTWHARATRNGNPELGGKLRSDGMESEGQDRSGRPPRPTTAVATARSWCSVVRIDRAKR